MQQKIKAAGDSRRTVFKVQKELKENGTLMSCVSTKIYGAMDKRKKKDKKYLYIKKSKTKN